MTKPTKSASTAKETKKKPKVAAPRKPRSRKEAAPAILHYEPRSSVTNLKLKNAMVTAAKSLRTTFLFQKRRFITMFYLDPGYINGGAETNASLQDNRAVWDELQFIPKSLVDTSARSLKTTLNRIGEPEVGSVWPAA